jgi:glycosyltransferase involved in cell wall biosynthesis
VSRPNSRTPDFDGRLSVVVPVRDEAGSIGPLVAEIDAALAGLADYEIVYVNDGSRDATAEALAQTQRAHPRLRVVHHAESCGQSAAIRSGVAAARFPWVATLDGDGQNDPADIPRLLEALAPGRREPGLELVAGWRAERRDSWLRRVSSRVANAVRGSLLGDRTPDTGCGLKLFGRELFLALPWFDHMHRFLPALVLREGGVVRSVVVSHRERKAGRSKYGVHNRLWVGIVDLLGVMWLMRRARRPRIVSKDTFDETPER